MRPDNETYALPYCPRPRREEAAHSWLTRVAQEYGLNADKLLGHLLPEHNAAFCLERAFYAPYVDSLSKATRIPRRTLSKLQGAPLDWILQDRGYCNVCIRCIEMDGLTGIKPFLRLEWRQAWKTNCSIHGIRLLRTTLGVRIVADFYFTMMPRHLPPFASESDVRTLRKTAEPGLRAPARGWADVRLGKQEASKIVETAH